MSSVPMQHTVSEDALEFGKTGYNRASKVIDDFTVFIARGNVVDLAGNFTLLFSPFWLTSACSRRCYWCCFYRCGELICEWYYYPRHFAHREEESWELVLRYPERTHSWCYVQYGAKEAFFSLHLSWSVHVGTIAEASADGAVTENLGRFLQTIFNFVIIGWIVFIIVKGTIPLPSLLPSFSSLPNHSIC